MSALLLKVGGLAVRTLAKPVANRLKIEVKRHPVLSSVCAQIGELSHQATSRIDIISSGYRVVKINPLPVEDARSRGINFVSETFIFTVGVVVMLFEYSRSEAKSALKAAKTAEVEAQFRKYLDEKFNDMDKRINSINARLDEIEYNTKNSQRKNVTISGEDSNGNNSNLTSSWYAWFFERSAS